MLMCKLHVCVEGKLVCFILSLFVQLFLIIWENVVNFLLRPFSDNSSIVNILPIFQIFGSFRNIKYREHKLSVNAQKNRSKRKSQIFYLKAEVVCWPGHGVIMPHRHHFMTAPFEFLIVASNLSRCCRLLSLLKPFPALTFHKMVCLFSSVK